GPLSLSVGVAPGGGEDHFENDATGLRGVVRRSACSARGRDGGACSCAGAAAAPDDRRAVGVYGCGSFPWPVSSPPFTALLRHRASHATPPTGNGAAQASRCSTTVTNGQPLFARPRTGPHSPGESSG